jgi:hypothetical protein
VTVPAGGVVLVTVILPVLAPVGTIATSLLGGVRLRTVAATPLNFTDDVDVNPVPVIVTSVPLGPLEGVKLVIDSVGVKFAALVAVPAAVVTEIFPVVAPSGTVALIWSAETIA